MRITKLCILCSVSKVLGPLAKGSLRLVLSSLPIPLGTPKTPKAIALLLPQSRAPLGLEQRSIKYLGTKSTPQTFCFCSCELTVFVEISKKGGVSKSLIRFRTKRTCHNISIGFIRNHPMEFLEWSRMLPH